MYLYKESVFDVIDQGTWVWPNPPRPAPSGECAGTDPASQMDLNLATVDELEELTGVGPATAKKIVASRRYCALDELVSKGAVSQLRLDSWGCGVFAYCPAYERPPYVVSFRHVPSSKRFLAIGVHTTPERALDETSELATVYADASSRFSTKDAIILGDFNADCSYILKGQWKCARDPECTDTVIKLWNPEKFTWWIDDDADTTTSSTDCAYDRIVTAGSFFKDAIQQKDVSVFDFQSWLRLSEDDMKDVSDHYPVEAMVQFPSNTRIAFRAEKGVCQAKQGRSRGILKGLNTKAGCQLQCADDQGCNAFGIRHSQLSSAEYDCILYYADSLSGDGTSGNTCFVKYEETTSPGEGVAK